MVDLTDGSVGRRIVRLTLPMVAGIFAIVAFNVTDTYFVSRLGTLELAAMGFAFPVVMTIGSLAMGIGLGASSCISRAIGQGDEHRVKRLATDSLILTVLLVSLFATAGLLTIGPLFRALGAPEDVLVLIRQYMTIWYSCVAVLFIPMVGNNAIRATGDTVTPSLIMIIAAVINVVLDPLLIFGLAGFPRLELQGAAVATVTSRFLSMIASMLVLHYRYRLIEWTRPHLRELLSSWWNVLHIGLPAGLTNMLRPLTNGVLVRLVASFGKGAVAAFGAGGRVEHFAYIVPIAMGTSLVPFVGQNWGAGRVDRVWRGWRFSAIFGIGWGVTCFAVSIFAAGPIAGLFSENADVAGTMALYLRVLFASLGTVHVSIHTGFALNAMGKPLTAAGYNAFRLLVLTVPLAYVGRHFFGLVGIFAGMSAAFVLSSLTAVILMHRVIGRGERNLKH